MWVYILTVAVLLFLIYCAICIVWTTRMREVAMLLREILDGQWGDVMKQLVNEEYVEAVLRACKMVMEDVRL